MGIFGKRDLPPLDGGDEARLCHTIGCGNLMENGLPFCLDCLRQRMRLAYSDDRGALDAWPTRPITRETPAVTPTQLGRIERELPSTLNALEMEQEAELVRMFAAPLFTEYDKATDTYDARRLDRCCEWCCRILNEGIDDPRAIVRPAKLHYLCKAHSSRHDALQRAHAKIDRMTWHNKQSTAQIAVHFRYGYLGEYLAQQQHTDR